MLSYDSFIFIAKANDTEGNMFSLCNSTDLRLTFEVSINKHHSHGVWSCLRGLITAKVLLQNTKCPS